MSQATFETKHWLAEYRKKVMTPEQAVQCIESGHSIYIQSNAGAPQPIISALVNRAHELRGVQIFHLLTLGPADYAKPEYTDSFRVHALFIGTNVRESVNKGIADYTPVFLSEVPGLFQNDILPVDVCLIQVSPPDAHGNCSLGVSVDCTIAARKKARIVIAEVNRQMPRTLGRSFVHVSRLTHVVETDRVLPELIPEPPSEVEQAIGEHVASLVEDEATLQLGIGGIPNAVLANLKDKKRLGVHSEMLSDGIVDLIEDGVVTCNAKTFMPGKVVVSFVMGTRRLYDFVDNNPFIEFQTSDFVNDPFIIAQNYRMTSINSAINIDLTGQVSADSVGTRLYSGFGGQVDFIRGAARSKGGKAIIALPSTAKHGQISRINPCLPLGSGVVTSRADVHYVVTEFGIAHLYGRNLKDRAAALISIAHPNFRAELEEQAAKMPWLRSGDLPRL